MFSLKSFHRAFILLASFGADLFGVWAVWRFARTGDLGLLILGIVSVLGGLGLIFYLLLTARKLDDVGLAR